MEEEEDPKLSLSHGYLIPWISLANIWSDSTQVQVGHKLALNIGTKHCPKKGKSHCG